MSSVLSGSALSPTLLSHEAHAVYAVMREDSTSAQVLLQARMAPSSMYRLSDVHLMSRITRSRACVNSVERTGEIGEPCGVPPSERNGSEVWLLNFRQTERSERKDFVHETISSAKPRSATTWTSRPLLILSK